MNSSPRKTPPASGDVRLFTGDSLAILPTFTDASFDAVVTDPPYELDLMHYKWDASGIAYSVELWRECLRVLKPGGHLLAFGAPRTYHRMTAAIEDAGFEIRDSIHWIYSNGFPKGTDVSKAIDRRRYDRDAVLRVTKFVREARERSGKTNAQIDTHLGTRGMATHFTSQSQPAVPRLEQWAKLKDLLGFGDEMDAEVARLCERKGKLGEAWEQRGITGQYDAPAAANQWSARYDNKPATTAKARRDEPATAASREWKGWGTVLKPAHEPIVVARKRLIGSVADNVLQFRTGALNVEACRVRRADDDRPEGRLPANVIFDEEGACELDAAAGTPKSGERKAEPSRFFYVAKASPSERRAGLTDDATRHPTIKPVTLMRYLVRLVTPPGGVVLDPFTGSGSTGIAAVLEGKRFVGIERDPDYVTVASARINHWKGETEDERRAA